MPDNTYVREMVNYLSTLFRQLGPEILSHAGNISHTDKNDGSPVTEIDTLIEDEIIASMSKAFPEAIVYGEESGYAPELEGDYWLIDPIDGTSSFIANTPTYTNMAVYISHGLARAAIIYNPSTDQLYTAINGMGTYKNGEKLDLTKLTPTPIALCKGRDLAAISDILESSGTKGFVAPDGAGNAFAMVAEGAAAAKFSLHSRGHIHDYAPGALIVTEAGGAIIPLDNEIYDYRTKNFIACHPTLMSTIKERIESISALNS